MRLERQDKLAHDGYIRFRWSRLWYMAYGKLTRDGPATPSGLVDASLSHVLALFVAVSVGANISCGHVNHAVTFGAFIGENITFLRTISYCLRHYLY